MEEAGNDLDGDLPRLEVDTLDDILDGRNENFAAVALHDVDVVFGCGDNVGDAAEVISVAAPRRSGRVAGSDSTVPRAAIPGRLRDLEDLIAKLRRQSSRPSTPSSFRRTNRPLDCASLIRLRNARRYRRRVQWRVRLWCQRFNLKSTADAPCAEHTCDRHVARSYLVQEGERVRIR